MSSSEFGGLSPRELKKKRPIGKLVTIIALSLALAGSLAALTVYIVELDRANARIAEQNQEIEDQRELIDRKESFGAALERLMNTAKTFDGVLFGDIVPLDDYEELAREAWVHRWDGALVESRTQTAIAFTRELEKIQATAETERIENATGTTYETVIDKLGGGLVSSTLGNADALCKQDVLGCVLSDDPHVVHFDAASNAKPYMTEWLRTGVAYHEFAHVLQFTNPDLTETALDAFNGDHETMADCFALTYLDGWTLNHRVYTGRYQYWDVDIGYGYTCSPAQKQAIKEWYSGLGFQYRTISQ